MKGLELKPTDKVTYPVPPKHVAPEDNFIEDEIPPQLDNADVNPTNPEGEVPLNP